MGVAKVLKHCEDLHDFTRRGKVSGHAYHKEKDGSY